MPGLLTLQTDLKSLRYGQDTLGGGNSDQPYIQTDIQSADPALYTTRLIRNDDGFVRGGIIGSINASLIDARRIAKFFTDYPKGPLFLARQVGLQLSNPKLEGKQLSTNNKGTSYNTSGPNFFSNIGNSIINVGSQAIAAVRNAANRSENIIGYSRIYNTGINTLAQVPLNAIGGHIVRHGFLPNEDRTKYYEAVVTENNFVNGTNRLLGLTNKFSLGPGNVNKPINNKETIINEYLGGPSSVYGLGNTIIRRDLSRDTENIIYIDAAKNRSTFFSGKTRRSDGTSQEVVLKTTKDFEVSNKTGSLFTKDTFNNNSFDDLNNSFLYYVAKDSDKDLPKINVAASIDSGTQLFKSGKLFGVSNKSQSQLGSGSFLPTDGSIASDPSNNSSTPLSSPIGRVPDITKDKDGSYNTLTPNITPNIISTGPDAINSYDPTVTGVLPSSPNTPQRMPLITGANPTYADYKRIVESKKLRVDPPDDNIYGIYTTQTDAIKASNDIKPSATSYPKYNNGSSSIKINIPWNSVSREKRIGSGKKDEINLTPIFDGNKGFESDTIKINSVDHNIRDLIRLRIQAVNTDSPENGKWMVFRAYLTDLSDNVDATWNEVKYAGRGDKFWIYDGFSRKMSIGFKVAALSGDEMKPMYQKLNFLMSNLMPDYSNNLMRGPLVRMSVGSYIDSQLGKLDSLSYKIPQDSPWEIAIDKPEGGSQILILPHIVEVTLGFTPIGSESKGDNKIQSKSTSISHIAQNNTGDTGLQYV
jgi:hypothetical protein